MNCPNCGSEQVFSYQDEEKNLKGFYCDDCKHTFGLDDGKRFKELEDALIYCSFKKKEGDDYKLVTISQVDDDIILAPTRFLNKKPIAYKKVNVKDFYSMFKKVIFENFFILDWNNEKTIDEEKDYYQIVLKFADREDIIIQGNKFPPYIAEFDKLFLPFFKKGNIW